MKAFVVGATGGVGGHLVRNLACKNQFEKVVLITRRPVDFPEGIEVAILSKFEQKIVDFDTLETNHAADFEGFDVGFCALGTTKAKAGKEGFIKVDHDYVVGTAKLAKIGGCKHFQLVSAGGASKDSSNLYFKTKGQVEEEVRELNFERLTIWRPKILLVERNESRPGERLMQSIARIVDCARFWSIEVPLLARAMVYQSFKPAKSPVEIIENRDIHFMSKEKSS